MKIGGSYQQGKNLARQITQGIMTVGLILGIGLTANNSSAMWEKMSIENLVLRSELIVVGEIVAVTRADNSLRDVATIRVDEILMGPQGLTTVLLVMPGRERAVHSSRDLMYTENQRGVWFLRKQPASARDQYLADHPQRLQRMEQLGVVREVLQRLHARHAKDK